MSPLLNTKQGKMAVAGIVGGIVVVAALVVVFLVPRVNDDYRTIQVYRVEGAAEVDRPGVGTSTPYQNMMLQNDDHVSTMVDGWLYLLMDGTKYLLAEPQTTFTLQASGTKAQSQTHLALETGTLVNDITEPLGDGSAYEVSTPNSVMAVRGTSFRVSVTYDEDGTSHTTLQVFESEVSVRLAYPDGSLSEERTFHAGQTACIWGDSTTSDYESVFDTIDYAALDLPTLEFIQASADAPEVDEAIKLKQTSFTVRFVVDGRVFGTQQVLYDHCATEPVLRPKASGSWDFDFDTPIRADVDVSWR